MYSQKIQIDIRNWKRKPKKFVKISVLYYGALMWFLLVFIFLCLQFTSKNYDVFDPDVDYFAFDRNNFKQKYTEYDLWTHKVIQTGLHRNSLVGRVKRFRINNRLYTTPIFITSPLKHGEMGGAVRMPFLTPELKRIHDDGWEKNAFNQLASDLISLHRTLPKNIRPPWCEAPNRFRSTNLPSTSVVICFHNEAWSTLLRTVHSVLDQSPPHLIHEIVLVDDFSDLPHLGQELTDYVNTIDKVKLVRAPERIGLIQARMFGVNHSSGEVITFLDSHCECAPGWLEPLLNRIADNNKTVVCPVIDPIDRFTMEYTYNKDVDRPFPQVGGFDWDLQFHWHSMPLRSRAKAKNSAEPLPSPTMAGGIFSIHRSFFKSVGFYDDGFDIWGGENLELSFKTWMCGGRLEIIPCSHVGHIFREKFPYKWRTGIDVSRKNLIRLARVWLDDYAQLYFERTGPVPPELDSDVSGRIELRKSMQCKDFKWYIENIYPDILIPSKMPASGKISVTLPGQNNYCIYSLGTPYDLHKPIPVLPCKDYSIHMWWLLSPEKEIRRAEVCFDYNVTEINLWGCNGQKGNQVWRHDKRTKLIYHEQTKKCLTVDDPPQKLILEKCQPKNPRFLWSFTNYLR